MNNIPEMNDLRPYMFNAYWSWLNESGVTAYIHVNTIHPGVRVPQNYVQPDGTITLNISFRSAPNITLDDDILVFGASFGGKQERLVVPLQSILAIFAAENPKIGTNLYSPDESTGMPMNPVASKIMQQNDKVAVDIPEEEIENTPPPQQAGPSIADKVHRRLSLVQNEHSGGEKELSDKRATLKVVH
ncbi:MAG: hypothetical protein JXR12_05800 [Neptunomonas phycophila]|uniref:stringent starvation protein B n=1 Tax=Neptunomonas phycophila TaxID=1572645 RepID=UPI003B8AC93B